MGADPRRRAALLRCRAGFSAAEATHLSGDGDGDGRPDSFSSSLRPDELSLQAYQQLLESEGVVSAAIDHLQRAGRLGPGERPRVGAALRSRILLSKDGSHSLAPLIEISARSDDAETAADLANTWAQVFIEQAGEIVTGSLEPSLRVVESTYREQRDRVGELESARRTQADRFRAGIDELTEAWERRRFAERQRWDRKLVEQRQESEDLLAQYQEETRRVMAAAAPAAASAGQAGSAPPSIAELVVLRTHLAQASALVVLDKSITDDALWMKAPPSDADSGGVPRSRRRVCGPRNRTPSIRISNGRWRASSRRSPPGCRRATVRCVTA